MVIIEAIRRKKGTVFVLSTQGGEKYEIDKKTLQEYALAPNLALEDEALQNILQISQSRRANTRAVWLLSRKGYSSAGLEKKLLDVCPPDVAKQTVAHMQQLGFLNDEEYARTLASDLLNRRKYGARRAMQELLRQGIDKECARQVLQETDCDVQGNLQALILRKYKHKLLAPNGQEKVYAALLRLGYGFEESRQAIKAALLNMENDEEEYNG